MTVKVIAELGCNFDTRQMAHKMIHEAKQAGCGYVKFQLFNEEVIKDSPLRDRLKPLILDEKDIIAFKGQCDCDEIALVLTPMYLEAVDIAAKYADMIKIRFKDNENTALKLKAWETGKPVLISVSRPILNDFSPRIFPMYCLPVYPPEPEDFNLEVATACRGFSSHYPHTLFDLAFAINRLYDDVYIEKHVRFPPAHMVNAVFTIDRNNRIEDVPPPLDAVVSITFDELRIFVNNLKILERMRRIRL